ncbi:MAG: glycine cleavage system protein GcvH [Coxiellaceae bacterium]|nr:glycine cleavage system protein GcvH [Coxiellaceae bacterium]
MTTIPQELHYSESHEWILIDENNVATVGITDHAQDQLGEVVFVELPEVGSEVVAGEEAVVVESVKTAADVYSPLTGEVVEVNTSLEDEPNQVNHTPYTEGWLYKVKINDKKEMEQLMTADAYTEQLQED